MGSRGPKPIDEKRHVLAMLRMGEFTSLVEAALVAGISPQRIGQWCKAEKLDWRARRKARVKALWLMAMRRQRRGDKPARKFTKAQREAETARLVADYHAKKAR
jgi:ethanolamine utilization protein EutQ (cupin superfamily)